MAKPGRPPTGRKSSQARAVKQPWSLPDPPLNVRPVTALRLMKPVAPSRHSPLTTAFQHIKGGWRHYVEYVDFAARKGNEAMIRYRDVYMSLSPAHRMTHWPEQLCELANVSPGELVGEVCRAIWETKAAESSMVSSIAHPEMLMSTIRFGKKEENFRDRELYFRMMGSLPDRKGNSINIFNQAAGQVGTDIPELGSPAKMRSFDEEVVEMSRDLESDVPFIVSGDGDVDDVSPEDS
jgi:hypothetical protein